MSPLPPIFWFSCNFWQKLANRPHFATNSGKSWIFHWIPCSLCSLELLLASNPCAWRFDHKTKVAVCGTGAQILWSYKNTGGLKREGLLLCICSQQPEGGGPTLCMMCMYKNPLKDETSSTPKEKLSAGKKCGRCCARLCFGKEYNKGEEWTHGWREWVGDGVGPMGGGSG